jgi:hypothetical protein
MAKAPQTISRRELKRHLKTLPATDLVNLVADLYDFDERNRAFVEARFGLAEDGLAPYKRRIWDALYPDIFKGGTIQLSAARKAIRDYRRAVRAPEGVIELLIYYVATGTNVTLDYGDIDDAFYDSLASVFDEAVSSVEKGDPNLQERFVPRLAAIVKVGKGLGWGYGTFLVSRFAAAFPDGLAE